MPAANESATSRGTAFTLLILASAAMMAGRILAADQAILSANDRSRWCTIRALVDHGTYAIGRRQPNRDGTYRDYGITAEKDWNTVDKVLHPDRRAFYSSKPPLFPTVAAVVYWMLKHTLGWSITEERAAVVRCTLLVVNCLPLTIYLVLLGRLVEQFGRTDWGRLVVLAAACFGTYLTTFAAVLNNHTVAACFVLFALYQAFLPSKTPARSRVRLAAAGFFAASAAAADLPAAAFLAWLGFILFRRSPRLALFSFAPAAALPVAAFMLTNYLAIGQLLPAYGEFGGPWYTYDGSYWQGGPMPGLDAAGDKETKIEYALHLLFGHHGLFSLTPIFLLALLGEVPDSPHTCKRPAPASEMAPPDDALAQKNALGPILYGTWLLAAVVLGFYVFKTSNYGGNTAGPRWLFWLTPLLLLSALPAADAWSRRPATRLLGYAFLAASIFSAHFSTGKPWYHPWLYQFMDWNSWLPY
jgi:hypothetical protein